MIFKARASARLLAAALAGTVAVVSPLSVTAATIAWGPATSISGDTDVITTGTPLYAYTGGRAAAVNGVSFIAGTTTNVWGNVSFSAAFTTLNATAYTINAAPFNGLSTAYSNVLSGANYGGTAAGTVTLNGLTAGHDYAVQIWVNDPRSGITATRTETVTNSGLTLPNTYQTLQYNSYGAAGGAGQFSVGYFGATSTNQIVTLVPSATTPANASLQLNAISVLDEGLSQRIWLGTSDTSWGTAGNWSSGLLPFPNDAILFNNLSTGYLGTTLDTSYTVATLNLSNAPSAVTIGAIGGDGGNTLTIDAGLNLFDASDNLTINDPVVLGGFQTWSNNGTMTVNAGVSGSAALTIAGSGRLTFTQPATYLYKTIINGGTLALSGSGSVASGTIQVAGGATFDVSATTTSPYAMNTATLTNSSAGAVINGTNDCSSATITTSFSGGSAAFIQTNGTMTLSPSTVVNINNPGTVLAAGSYPIIAAAQSGNIGAVTAPGGLPSVNLTGNGAVGGATLNIAGNGDLQLVIATPYVWTGSGLDGLWTTANNWNPANEPGGGEAILFNSSSINNLSSISQNDGSGGAQFGVSVLNPAGPITIGGANALAIYAGGLNLSAASQSLTINAPLIVNANQQWNVTNNQTLTIGGPVSTISGGSVTILGGGTVQMGASGSLTALTNASPGAGDFTVVNSTLDLKGTAQAINGLYNSSGVVDNTAAGTATLTLGGNGDPSTNCGVVFQNTGGALTLQVAGGDVQLLGTNTYGGGTIFNGGRLYFPSSSPIGTGPVTFNPGSGTYTAGRTFTNALTLNGGCLRVGGGNLNVQNWSGPITIVNSFQMSGDAGTKGVTLSGPINIGTGGIAITNSGGNGTPGSWQNYGGDYLSGGISGSGDITYYLNGSNSRLWLQGTNTYSGNTVVNGTSNGKLNVYGAVTPFGAGTVTLNAGAIIESYNGNATVTNALTLNGGTLEGESFGNSYNRLTWAGPITLTANSSLFQYGENNGQMSQGVNVAGPLNMNGFTLTNSGTSGLYSGSIISGPISGAGTILETVNALYLQGTNTFTGTFRAVGGQLNVQNAYALQNATLDMNAADAGSVTLNNLDAVIGDLTGSRNLSLGNSSVSIGNNNASTTYGGILSSNGSLTKIGSGTLTLSGVNTYSGNTTVNGGTLEIQQPTLTSNATVTVAGGAFLNLSFDATNVVAALVLNGASQPNGIYKSGNSGGRITGIGAIQVINPNVVWTGASSTSWNTAGNWLTGTIPGTTNNVIFNSLSTANLATVLNADFNVLALTVTNAAGPVSVGGANSLTVNSGINVQATQPLTIAAPLVLGAAQTWTVTNTSSGLSVSNLTGAAALTFAGGGTVVLNGTNSSTGNRIITGGTTLKFAGTGTNAFQTSGTIYVANTTTTGTIDLNGKTQTSPSFVAFPYTSTTTITNGTLICNAGNSLVPNSNPEYQYLGTINLASNGYYITSQRLLLGNNYNNFSMTINGTSVGGAVTFGGDNNSVMNYVGVAASQAGNLNINGGTVNFTNSSVGTGNGWLNVGANAASAKGSILVNGGSLNVGTWMKMSSVYNTFAGQSSTSALTITNNGSVSIGGGSAGTNGILFMGGGNGDATANTGVSTLNLANGSTLTVAQIQAGNNGTKTINLNGGTIVARPGATNLFMSAATGLTVNLQSGGGTINSGTNSILIGSVLGSTGGLTKTGTGTLTLTNVNTYSGGTIVNAGTLLANSTSGTGTGAVNINSGGTLGGTGTIAGLVTNNTGGILMPGVAGSGTLNVTNSLKLSSGSTNTFVVNGTTSLASNSVALGAGAMIYGGVLNIVTNGTFTVGQQFMLFSGAGATNTSNFASIAGSPGAGKNFRFTNGVLSVVSSGPTLTSVTPNSLTGSSYAETLSLTGSGFNGATAVLLTNLTAATGASYAPTVNSDTSISVNFVPGTAASSWNATVVNGTPSAQVGFAVTVPTKVTINAGNLNSAGAGKLVLSGAGGVAGNQYAVVSATNLNPPAVWSPVVTNVFGAGGSFNYTNTVSPSTPSLFLRIAQ